MAGARSPYKFLDPYGPGDRELFFGRERETRILVADVIVSRLVVLFARTGTGKTSLINAGVRPALEERGYSTFLVRVRKDPAASLGDELLADRRTSALPGGPLRDHLTRAAAALDQPLVVFFDQFEEFFIYVMSRRDQRAEGRRFIADVAALHDDRDSGVHLVFSMREDFMAAMDDFREEIPTIFHQDSNLRLRWFDDEQARMAIAGPAAAGGVPFEDDLVSRLVADLRDDDGIEPAQLQIVCDTLWRRARDGLVTLADYEALGDRGGGGTIAERILKRRLEEEFENVASRERLELLARLLPMLRTPKGTKYIRDTPSLARELGTAEPMLRATLERLEERSRLVRRFVREGVEYVELTHDYLVGHLDDLSAAISTIWPRRVLRGAMTGDGTLDAGTQQDVEEVLERVRREHRRAAAAGDPAPGDVVIGAAEAAFLLRFALAARMQASVIVDAFAIAAEHGASALEVVRDALGSDPAAAESAVDLLVALGADEALELLPAVIRRGDDLAHHAVAVLSTIEASFAVDLLAGALAIDALEPSAAPALTALAASRRDPAVADRASRLLVAHVTARLDEAGVPAAIAALGRIEHTAAVAALGRVLGERPSHAGDVHEALLRLAGSAHPGTAAAAARALLERLSAPHGLDGVAPHVIERLGDFDDVAAVGVCERALLEHPLARPAAAALFRLRRSADAEVAARAEDVIDRRGAQRATPPPPPARAPEPVEPAPSPSVPLDTHLAVLVPRLLDGRVIPFLGAGVNLMGRPPDAQWARGRYQPSGGELAGHLADRFGYRRTTATSSGWPSTWS